jgi:hypothetical protein
MQYLLTQEEYDKLKAGDQHLKLFRKMIKEWHERMQQVFKQHQKAVGLKYSPVKDFVRDCSKTTDVVVKCWTPKEEDREL